MTIFALVDCNNFYASCERVFDPKLVNKPVAILSNNDGCIVARSNEVKALGIPMGAPYFEYKDILTKNKVFVLSSNYQLYGHMSERVVETLKSLAPEVEVYSIDEVFLKLDSLAWMDLEEYAKSMRETVLKWTGIPVSIGIGTSKTLAKVANHVAKKTTGVCDLRHEALREQILNKLEVQDIWGIGRKLSVRLNYLGIYTAKQLANADPKLIRKSFGVVGEKVVQELRGQACFSLDELPQPRKNIISSRSFGRPVLSLFELEEAVANYATTACIKMRKQRSRAQAITVFVTTNRFKGLDQFYANSNVYRFSVPTSDTRQIIKCAHRALKVIYKSGYKYNKAGIMLMDLVGEEFRQTNMFESIDHNKSDHLMKVIDGINLKQGKGTLFFAAQGIKRNWSMRMNIRSPRYTTQWDELPKVY